MIVHLNNGDTFNLSGGRAYVDQIRDATYIIHHRNNDRLEIYYVPVRSVLYIKV